MIKAFLSHSSSDKESYVRIVANRLGPANCVYDEYTFEAGMPPVEEILRGLHESQVFVVFLSDAALNSKWVHSELLEAHRKLQERELERIFPIIIDPTVTYDDGRIPEWMKDQYNLKYVSRPTVAARRIQQRLREICWRQHPKLDERNNIFVGRNALLKLMEERLDEFDRPIPVAIIASGLPRIGRSSLLRHGLIKGNVVRQSYEFPSIVLRRGESVEDAILKLYDLGFSNRPHPLDLMDLTLDERTRLLVEIAEDVQRANEVVLIHDDGCLVTFARDLQPWFDTVCRQIEKAGKITFLLASRYRPLPGRIRRKDYVYAVDVPELSYPERTGLLKRLIELEDMALTGEDFSFFAGLLQGLPDQARFACDLIKDHSVDGAKRESHQITEFNSDRAAVVLAQYGNRQDVLDFLYLLSEFEFISSAFLYSIVSEDTYRPFLDEFVASAICDFVGIEREFIRLNDTIRDYVRRNRLQLPARFKAKLESHLDAFLADPRNEDRDISDLSYSIKEAIKCGTSAPQQYLIPSHFLRSMRELYQQRGHLDRVIELADMLLAKRHLLDTTVANDVRYYLCLSLARKRDQRLLREVQGITGPEHNFLLGFYYRLQGRARDAIEQLTQCVNKPMVSARAKRELVQVYLSVEDYDNAAALARANYEENRTNAFHVQAYFNTIVNSRRAQEQRVLLLRLISELASIRSELSEQMVMIAKAEFLAKCEGDYDAAVQHLDDAAAVSPESHYPQLVKAYLAARNRDLDTLKQARARLAQIGTAHVVSGNSLARLTAYTYALEGDLPRAISYAESNLRGCPDNARESFLARLRATAQKDEGGVTAD